MNSNLAMPKLMSENSFLDSINTNLTKVSDAVHVDLWIGGKYDSESQTWKWVDGKEIDIL